MNQARADWDDAIVYFENMNLTPYRKWTNDTLYKSGDDDDHDHEEILLK